MDKFYSIQHCDLGQIDLQLYCFCFCFFCVWFFLVVGPGCFVFLTAVKHINYAVQLRNRHSTILSVQVNIKETNVCYLLPAATMFQMYHVVEACTVFLEHQLDPTNCIGIADFASEHGCSELEEKARKYIRNHFCQVCSKNRFSKINFTKFSW